ncbi:MAG: hypothetical protein ACE149_17410 [Armatimonadota bacterium]
MTRKLCTLALLTAVAVLAAGGALQAMPSLAGPTGIVSVPNALVAPQGQLQAALSFQQQSQEMYGGSVDTDVWQLTVLAGVAKQAELWAAYALADQDSPTASETAHLWALGGKYQLTSEPKDQASLAIGASMESWSDLAMSGDMYGLGLGDLDVIKAYIVATKDFTPMTGGGWEYGNSPTRILGSVGLLYARIDPDLGDDMSMTRPFVGIEFLGSGGTDLGLEYRWKDSDIDEKAVFSAVLTHKFSKNIEAQIGTTNAGPAGVGLDDQDIFLRLGYTFPMKAY